MKKKALYPILIIALLTASMAVHQKFAGAAEVAFVTSYTTTSLRNNFPNYVGGCFTVGASSVTVTKLGRWVVSGNSGTHTLKLTTASSATAIVSTSVNTSGAGAGAFLYGSVTPTVLSASTQYCVLSLEVDGGDQWYDTTATNHVDTTAVATLNAAVYESGGLNLVNVGTRTMYVGVDFKYDVADPAPPATTTDQVIFFN